MNYFKSFILLLIISLIYLPETGIGQQRESRMKSSTTIERELRTPLSKTPQMRQEELQKQSSPIESREVLIEKTSTLPKITFFKGDQKIEIQLPELNEFAQEYLKYDGKLNQLKDLVIQATDVILEIEKIDNENYESFVNSVLDKALITTAPENIFSEVNIQNKPTTWSTVSKVKKIRVETPWSKLKLSVAPGVSPMSSQSTTLQSPKSPSVNIQGPSTTGPQQMQQEGLNAAASLKQQATEQIEVSEIIDPQILSLLNQLSTLNIQINQLKDELWNMPDYLMAADSKLLAELIAIDFFDEFRSRTDMGLKSDVPWIFLDSFCDYDIMKDKTFMKYMLGAVQGDPNGALEALTYLDRNLACSSALFVAAIDYYFAEAFEAIFQKMDDYALAEYKPLLAEMAFNPATLIFDECKFQGSSIFPIFRDHSDVFLQMSGLLIKDLGLWYRIRSVPIEVAGATSLESTSPPGNLAEVNFDDPNGTAPEIELPPASSEVTSFAEATETPFGADPDIIRNKLCGKKLSGNIILKTLANFTIHLGNDEWQGHGVQGLGETIFSGKPDIMGICGSSGMGTASGGGAQVSCSPGKDSAKYGGGRMRFCGYSTQQLSFAGPVGGQEFGLQESSPQSTLPPGLQSMHIQAMQVGVGCPATAGGAAPEGSANPPTEKQMKNAEEIEKHVRENAAWRNWIKKQLEKSGFNLGQKNAAQVEKALDNAKVTAANLPPDKMATVHPKLDSDSNIVGLEIAIDTTLLNGNSYSDLEGAFKATEHEIGHAYIDQEMFSAGNKKWKEDFGFRKEVSHDILKKANLFPKLKKIYGKKGMAPQPDSEMSQSCAANAIYVSYNQTCAKNDSNNLSVPKYCLAAQCGQAWFGETGSGTPATNIFGQMAQTNFAGTTPTPDNAQPGADVIPEAQCTIGGGPKIDPYQASPGFGLVDPRPIDATYLNGLIQLGLSSRLKAPLWLVESQQRNTNSEQ